MTRRSPRTLVVLAVTSAVALALVLQVGYVRTTLAAGPSSPAKIAASPAKRLKWACSHCHTTAGWKSIPKRIDFDHKQTGVPLFGAHEKAACVGCHKPHDPKRAMGDQKVPRDCVSCHTDNHRGELGQRCNDCHTSTTWAAPRRFPKHDATRFPLTGAHTFVACASCHTRQGRDEYRGTPATCDSCHRKDALAVGYFPHAKLSAPCNQCHTTFSWAPARVDHAIWWPLLGSHAAVASSCTQSCHTTARFSDQSRFCATCHGGDVAGAYPDHKALGFANDCSNCHQPFGWKNVKHTFHEGWFTLLAGPHRRYQGAGKCASCHTTGIGGGKFECVGCHDGSHEQKRTAALHANIGGFVYENAACKSCHPKGKF